MNWVAATSVLTDVRDLPAAAGRRDPTPSVPRAGVILDLATDASEGTECDISRLMTRIVYP